MQRRHLIRLAAVLVALVGLAYFTGAFESNPSTLKVPDISVDRDQVEAFEIRSPSFSTSLTRSGQSWTIDGSGYPADSLTVRTFLTAFEDMDIESVVSRSPERYARYRVDSLAPFVRLRLEKNDLEYVVGQDGPDRQTGYIRTLDDERVFAATPRINVPLTMDRWRDKKIARIHPAAVSGVEVETPENTYALIRSDAAWQLRTGNDTEPADSAQVAQYLRRFNPFRVDGFFEELDDQAPETHTLRLELADGTRWVLGLREQNGAYGARVHGQEGAYRLLSTRLSSMFPDPETLSRE